MINNCIILGENETTNCCRLGETQTMDHLLQFSVNAIYNKCNINTKLQFI